MNVPKFLIGGTSHVGKSTFAADLSRQLGCDVVQTDKMGRHPGRPWPQVPEAVAAFYDGLSDAHIYWFLRVHHQNMAGGLRDLICQDRPLVVEGSALRPEVMVSSRVIGAAVLWAPDEFVTGRIRQESGFLEHPVEVQRRIEVFVRRSVTDNQALRNEAEAHGIAVVDVSQAGAVEALADDWLRAALG